MFMRKCHEITERVQLKCLESYLNIYKDQDHAQNMKMSFKFSPNVFVKNVSFYKLTLEWNFLSDSEMDQTGNPS